jgi:uncharacterized protein YjbI with pentapeptide repeats
LLGQTAGVTLTVTPVPVSTMGLTPVTATLIAGGTQQLTATVRDSAGSLLTGRVVTWSTNASAVATVNAGGLVTAVGPGTATISATSEGKTATASLTVLPSVAAISVTLASASIGVGQSTEATAGLRDAAGTLLTGRAVTWNSANTGIATVSNGGTVTGVALGTTIISATSEGRTGSSTITVVPPIASISISPGIGGLAIGRTRTLTATLLDANGNVMTGIPVTWQSSRVTVASVSSNGNLTGLSAGEVIISVSARGTTGSATFYIGRDYSGQNLAGTGSFRESDSRGASFASSNLTSADMLSGDFRYADFSGATMNGTLLRSANFLGANLSNTTWVEASVSQQTTWPAGFDPRGRGMWGPDEDYSGQNLSGKKFRYFDFTRSKFTNARLVGAVLLNVSMVGADMTGANLDFADLREASLLGASLSNTSWVEALYSLTTQWPVGFSPLGRGMFGPNENYSGRNFAGRSFYNLDFSGANFTGANLSGCSITAAALVGTNFTSANLANVNFSNSDLRAAILNGAVMTGATLTNARLVGATYNNTTIWPAGFDPVAAGAIRQ